MRQAPPSAAPACVALLRGINVGGQNMISMKALKESFERLGLHDVRTYINSGNVLFRSRAGDLRGLERRIERMVAREHGVGSRVVVRRRSDIARVVRTMAEAWQYDPAWKCNVMFLRSGIDARRVLAGIDLKAGLERVVCCPGALLWCARVDALARTAMARLAGQPIYQDMTVRNVNTATALLRLMEDMERPVARPAAMPASIHGARRTVVEPDATAKQKRPRRS